MFLQQSKNFLIRKSDDIFLASWKRIKNLSFEKRNSIILFAYLQTNRIALASFKGFGEKLAHDPIVAFLKEGFIIYSIQIVFRTFNIKLIIFLKLTDDIRMYTFVNYLGKESHNIYYYEDRKNKGILPVS